MFLGFACSSRLKGALGGSGVPALECIVLRRGAAAQFPSPEVQTQARVHEHEGPQFRRRGCCWPSMGN
eukprot:5894574-Alexandrium_andersonii.AAC.1